MDPVATYSDIGKGLSIASMQEEENSDFLSLFL